MGNSPTYNQESLEKLTSIIKGREMNILKCIKDQDLYQDLLHYTAFLNQYYISISNKQRIWHIRHGIYKLILDDKGNPSKFLIKNNCYKSVSNSPSQSVSDIVKSTKFGITRKLQSLGLLEKVKELTSFLPECSSLSQRIWHIRHDMYEIYYCPVCGKNPARYNEKKSIYHICSDECKSKQNKRIATDTSSSEKNEKIRKTCIERYGVENYSKTDDFKNSISKINYENVVLKSIETNLQKYGVRSTFEVEDFKNKARQTCIERYGVENYSQSEERLKALLQKNSQKFKNNLDKRYILLNYGKELSLHCNHCNKDFSVSLLNYQKRNRCGKIICTICNPLQENTSSGENELFEYIQSIYNNGEIIKNDRSVLSGLELDIYLPELNLAIEYNGLFWHSSFKVNSNYHYIKSIRCKEKGIHLIHVFEDDWIHKTDIVKSVIKNFINNSSNEKFFARKLICKKITNQSLVSWFLTDNHLLGAFHITTVVYGLYDQDQLISLMSFKELVKDSGDYELQRYAIKKNVTVIGGANKLLSHFIKNCKNLKSIITYNDNSVFKGRVYEKLGFTYIRTNSPNYMYVNRNSAERISKQHFRKSKLNYSETETEFTLSHGFYKIYNAGNDVYYMKIKD